MLTHLGNESGNWIMSSKRITIVLGTLLIAIFGYIVFTDAVRTWQNLQNQKTEIQNLNTKYEDLNLELDKTVETKQKSQEEVQKLEQEKQQLEQERQRLEKELQAKIDAKARLAKASTSVINTVTATRTASAISGCGDNEYANFIYMKESECRLDARNASGCLGIGQACPGSKLLAVCPSLDYACQNAFFTNYAVSRYGSWQGAYNAWNSKGWW